MVKKLQIEPSEPYCSYVLFFISTELFQRSNRARKLAFACRSLIYIWGYSNWRAKNNSKFRQKIQLLLFCPPSKFICYIKRNLHCREYTLQMLCSLCMEAEKALFRVIAFLLMGHDGYPLRSSTQWKQKLDCNPKLHLCIQANEN